MHATGEGPPRSRSNSSRTAEEDSGPTAPIEMQRLERTTIRLCRPDRLSPASICRLMAPKASPDRTEVNRFLPS